MPADPEPKDHYSYDDMLDRLRQSRGGSTVRDEEKTVDPETGKVTVRRRKRKRTGGGKAGGLLRQPGWMRVARKLAYVGFPIFALLVVVLYFVMAASVRTGVFQQGLGESLARQFGFATPLRLSDTRLSGLSLQIGLAEGSGDAGSPVKSFAAEGSDLRLSLSCLAGGDWDVEFCSIRRGGLRLGVPAPSAAFLHAPAPGLLGAGFLLSERPSRIVIHGFSVYEGMLLFGPEEEDKAPGFRNVRASFSRREQDGAVIYDGQLAGGREGRLQLPGWPLLGLEQVRLRIDSKAATIARSSFRLADETSASSPAAANTKIADAAIEANGTVPLGSGQASLAINAIALPVTALLPRGINRILGDEGTLHADRLSLTWSAGDPSRTWRLAGRGAVNMVKIRSLPLVSALSDLTGGDLNDSIDFEICQFDLQATPEGTELTNIEAGSPGRCQLEGEMRVDRDGRLSGILRIGIAPDLLLGRIPPALQRDAGGYYWAAINLDGTALAPVEDLTSRLRNPAAPPRAVPLAPEPGEEAPPEAAVPDQDRRDELFRALTGDEDEP
jgi:hypothetical protein